MEGTIIENRPDSRNILVQFDDTNTAGADPMTVAYRNLEHCLERGGYRSGSAPASSSAPAAAQAPKEPTGPLVEEHGSYMTRQLVEIHSLKSAAELNGKFGRLRKFDVNAERWEVDVRSSENLGIKRLKEDNLRIPSAPEVQPGLDIEGYKAKGNDAFKVLAYEDAIANYGAAIKLVEIEEPSSSEDEAVDADKKKPDPLENPPPTQDRKYASVLYGNRAQCYINLCREVHGEDRNISKEARSFAMKANMDSAKSCALDACNGKALYRRGCSVLGMAPSASRAKEAVYYLEKALEGRASGGKDGIVLPNAMRHEVSNLLDYAKRRFDDCTEMAMPDVEQCRENCRQQ
eukprot:TRINITY_DN22229_c0_g1_i1.p1 TRINITY_DN22229_c0_g1~~TRINITY_DN22229_c0_g1_i1.p1  ORF type:complete len:400 (-),score=66.91 TRINITY_DN22229_c0_g1_i1:188-1228(-)